jgi:antitoxin component HigA of HigAB toxin-antitoxin module
MRTVAKNSPHPRTADSYLALIQDQPLRAIRSRKDYDAAAEMIDRLAVRDDLDAGEQQYLDAIEVLIEAYENNLIPMTRDDRTPLERLKAAMRASNTTPVQLRTILGASQSMVSMILGGQRDLSKKAIARLAEHFNLDPGYFL